MFRSVGLRSEPACSGPLFKHQESQDIAGLGHMKRLQMQSMLPPRRLVGEAEPQHDQWLLGSHPF